MKRVLLSAVPVLAVLTLVLPGCKEESPAVTFEVDPTVRSYTVDGVIVAGTIPGDDPPVLKIRHEAMPDFYNDAGENVGMEAMTMNFPVGPGVDAASISEGDAVRVGFDVDFTRPGNPMLVHKLEVLDAAQPNETKATAEQHDGDAEHHEHHPHDPHGHHHLGHSHHVGTTHDHD